MVHTTQLTQPEVNCAALLCLCYSSLLWPETGESAIVARSGVLSTVAVHFPKCTRWYNVTLIVNNISKQICWHWYGLYFLKLDGEFPFNGQKAIKTQSKHTTVFPERLVWTLTLISLQPATVFKANYTRLVLWTIVLSSECLFPYLTWG